MNYRKSAAGYRSRLVGETFENIIKSACDYYREIGYAEIEKTPEPFKIERPAEKGKFYGHFEKKAQPDFKGTLKNGRAVVFEAKHTDGSKMETRRVTLEQSERLTAHFKLGALTFVLLSFGLSGFYTVPWYIWEDIPQRFGRHYVTADDLGKYKVKIIKNGVLDFLGTSGKETEDD